MARLVGFNVLGHTASMGIAFIASVALARILGPADRGLLAIMLLASTLPVALGSCGLPIAMSYFASRPETPRGVVVGHSLIAAGVLAGVFIPVFWFARGPISEAIAQGQGGDAWLLVGLLVPLTFLGYSTINHLWGRLAMGAGNAISVAAKVLHLTLVVVAVGMLGLGLTGALLATIAAAVLTVGLALPIGLRDGRPAVHWPTYRAMLRYGALLQVGTLSSLLNYRLDVFVLQHFRPLDDVGHYVVAQTVAEVVMIIAMAFQGSLIPLMARQQRSGQDTTTVSALSNHGVLAVAGIVVVAITGPVLILVAFGPAFGEALLPMFVLLPGMWFLGTGTVIAGDLQGRGRPGVASLLAVLAAVVTLALDVVFIPAWGVTGAALASLLAYTCFGIASLVVLSRVASLPLRRLLLPSRSELAMYPAACRRMAGAFRRQASETEAKNDD